MWHSVKGVVPALALSATAVTAQPLPNQLSKRLSSCPRFKQPGKRAKDVGVFSIVPQSGKQNAIADEYHAQHRRSGDCQRHF
jgi:hypothetical protein